MPRRRPYDPSTQTQPERDFIAALVEYQGSQRLSNPAFARQLGVSCALWRHIRDGRMPLGWKLWSAGSRLVSYPVATGAQAAIMDRLKGGWKRGEDDAA